MRRIRAFALATLAATVAAAASSGATASGGARNPAGPPDEVVASWDAIGNQALTASGLTFAEGHVIFAYEAIAVYDAVTAIEGGYRPFAVDVDAPRGASAGAAAATAAHAVLVHYLPGQAATILDPAYVASLAAVPDGRSKDDGVAVGERVAAGWLAARANDGFRASLVYTPPDPPIPGIWIPTAAPPAQPIGTYLAQMRPFSLASPDQFRPGGPPPLSSRRWARDYQETKDYGSATSSVRTADETLVARFWAEPPVQQAHGAFRRFVLDHRLDLVDASRFMAMISVAYADALIACFDAKYHYAFWRPVTAIRAADTDGNPRTVADPSWSPLIVTPNHPEYPAAHACVTTAGARVVARFLHTRRIDYTIPSLTGLGDRHYESVRDLVHEVENARIWGGIHYRTSVEDGAAIGWKTSQQMLAHHFEVDKR
jgi:hypothetical protein